VAESEGEVKQGDPSLAEAHSGLPALKTRQIRGKYLGVVTNNEAEYQAVLEALRWIMGGWGDKGDKGGKGSGGGKGLLKEIEEIFFKSDSLLVVSQLSGKWKIKDRNLQKLVMEVKKLERELGVPVRYQHIPRELNREADREVNRVLDESAIV
jgi:ribonuclease HI